MINLVFNYGLKVPGTYAHSMNFHRKCVFLFLKHPHWLDEYVSLLFSLFDILHLDIGISSLTCQPEITGNV